MRVWILTVGEPLPIDGPDVRLYRSGLLSRILAKRGHEVTWFSSAFDHQLKKMRHGQTLGSPISLEKNLSLVLLYGRPYRKNISFSRFLSQRDVADSFQEYLAKVEEKEKPDIILASYPTIELADTAVRYSKQANLPCIVDVRDLWPSVFLDITSGLVHVLAWMIAVYYKKAIRRIFRNAGFFTTLTAGYKHWIQNKAGSLQKPVEVFPMGYLQQRPDESDQAEARNFWKSSFGLQKGQKEYLFCFFGTINHYFDFDTIIAAALMLRESQPKVKFILAGNGEYLNVLKEKTAGLNNVVLPGWITRTQIYTLMQMSTAGLAPYIDINNFRLNIANKPIEYLSAGLPLFSGVSGSIATLISEHNIGYSYKNGDSASLYDVIIECISNPAERLEKSENALKLFRSKFQAEAVYSNMADYLENQAS